MGSPTKHSSKVSAFLGRVATLLFFLAPSASTSSSSSSCISSAFGCSVHMSLSSIAPPASIIPDASAAPTGCLGLSLKSTAPPLPFYPPSIPRPPPPVLLRPPPCSAPSQTAWPPCSTPATSNFGRLRTCPVSTPPSQVAPVTLHVAAPLLAWSSASRSNRSARASPSPPPPRWTPPCAAASVNAGAQLAAPLKKKKSKRPETVAGERHEELPGGRRPQPLLRPLRRRLQQPGAPRPDAVGDAGAGGRFPQCVAGAGRVPGSRGGAQGAALQVEGVADHEDPALGARLQLLRLQAHHGVPEAMWYRR